MATSAWSTLPNFEFSVHCCKGGAKIANTTMERYRDGKISIEKFELLEFDGDSEKLFRMIDKWLDIAL